MKTKPLSNDCAASTHRRDKTALKSTTSVYDTASQADSEGGQKTMAEWCIVRLCNLQIKQLPFANEDR